MRGNYLKLYTPYIYFNTNNEAWDYLFKIVDASLLHLVPRLTTGTKSSCSIFSFIII